MTNEKHTPGPLKYKLVYQNNAPNVYVITQGKWGDPNLALVEKEEDARLFAASTDLLALVMEMVAGDDFAAFPPDGECRHCGKVYPPEKIPYNCTSSECLAFRARQVIKKARAGALEI